ncbi:MAG TPA: FixH family protein, partial [Candidatus Defluviicoccus seviourii]|nr:FixH family protein [Candidatus Defluviicoccus seviourii]
MAGAKASGRPPGWWYPWIFVGGMLIVVAVNAVMAIVAVGTFSGLETTDHYRKGLAYQ